LTIRCVGMLNRPIYYGVIVLALMTAGVSITALAQSRKSVSLSTPGTLQGIKGPGYTFKSYSYGLGGLSRSTPSKNILHSSVSGSSNYKIRRASAGTGTSGLSGLLAKPNTRGVQYNTGVDKLVSGLPRGSGKELDIPAIAATIAYMHAVGAASQTQLKTSSEPITSMVPSEPSMYRDYMAKGEQAFRVGEYRRAVDMFRLANIIERKNPESLLEMTHGLFATGSYGSASFNLQQVIKYFPELPVVPLKPRGFYSDVRKYIEQRMRLEKYVRKYPYEGGPQLLLAYFLWFEDDVDGARLSLQRALAAAKKSAGRTTRKEDPLLEAIETFWRGMTTTGKVSGKLTPTTQPTTRPSQKRPPALTEH